MAYQLPVFNLVGNIWRNGNPVVNPPDVVSLCNLCLGRRGYQSVRSTPLFSNDRASVYALWPKGTDIRDNFANTGFDRVEIPAGSGRLYTVMWVDDAGGGFQNEHRVSQLVKDTVWPTPFPSPGATGGMPVGTPVVGWNTSITYPSHNPFVAPAGPMVIVMSCYSTPGVVSTISVTGLGVLTPILDSFAITNGLDYTGSQFFAFNWTGGLGAVDVVDTPFAICCGEMYSVPANTLDVSGKRLSLARTYFAQTDNPTTIPMGLAFVAYNARGSQAPFVLDPPWNHPPIFGFHNSIGALPWLVVHAQKVQPLPGIVDGLIFDTNLNAPPYWNMGDICTFK